MTAAHRVASSLLAFIFHPDVAFMLCYGAGFAATHQFGQGAAGQPLINLAAPLAAGFLIRNGRSLSPTDALRLAAVHLAVAAGLGVGLTDLAWTLFQNLATVACSVATFARLRRSGFISSEVRMAVAVTIAAATGALAGAPVGAAAGFGSGATLDAVLTCWAAAWVGSSLLLGVVLTRARSDQPLADEFDADEPKPALWEAPAAACLIATLILASVGQGRPEIVLAASCAMLWFALRLGLFATWLGAFCFSAALLAYMSEGLWPAFADAAEPMRAELMRYLALALLAGPSVLVAAHGHDQKRLRRILAYRAMHDGLTKLVNRVRFLEVLDAATAKAHSRGSRFALFLIDLDHFKSVNDGFGHQRGDALLVEVSARLRDSLRSTDVVARLGGDEFAVVAPLTNVDDGMKLAKRLVETVNQPFLIDGVSLLPSITLGGVLSPDSEGDAQRLILLADEALYAAKAAGRNCWRFSSVAGEAEPVQLWRPGVEGQLAFDTVYLD
ncbi:GGDEF domain-containing protein [Chelatococcus sambhunathii]|uniref:GGDEF domain-containing protein n=1 Tax=Chelatococcus sambhunathii TaxID=363953 RepID=A0ABU1DE47_9HYPH|nr:GGDEF domain-containing protein [Chelatococcus sambhunathii]MDR4306378.1 GGDEF domain-containing protein [Chelatococcus sambhunathii]